MAIGDPTRGKARKPPKAANVLPLVRDADPPEGWTPNCAFGLQRIDATPRGRTVRLEDVAVELAQTMGRQQVIDALFRALVADDGAEALQLHVLTANGYAKPLFVASALNPDANGYWLSFDALKERTEPAMVARSLGWAWMDAWPGLSDFHTDSQAWTERIIAQNRAQPGTSARFDTEDRLFMLQLLRRLAVPVAVAHQLWGYGTAAAAAVQLIGSHEPPQNLCELKAQRIAEKGSPWTPEQRELLHAEVERRKARRETGVIAAIALKLEVSKQALSEQLRKREKARNSTPSSWVNRI